MSALRRRPRGAAVVNPRRLPVAALAIGLLLPGSLASQAADSAPARVPRSAMAGEVILGEVLAGALLAGGLSWGFAVLGGKIAPDEGEDPGLVASVTGFLVGTTLGASLGVHLAARAFHLPARYYEALGGAVAGTLVVIALPLDMDEASSWVAVYGLPILGAVLTSSIGSRSRLRVSVQPAAGGAHVGVGFDF